MVPGLHTCFAVLCCGLEVPSFRLSRYGAALSWCIWNSRDVALEGAFVMGVHNLSAGP